MNIKNKDTYRQFQDPEVTIPLFHQAWWLDTVVGKNHWDTAVSYTKDGKIRAVWPYVLGSKWTISTMINPILTPYLGPYIIYPQNQEKKISRYNFEHKVMYDLVHQLPNAKMQNIKCHPDLDNVMPLILKGYWHHAKYTYRIINDDKESVYQNLKASVRTDIKKAKSKYTLDKSINTKILYRLNQKTFERKSKTVPFSQELIDKIVAVSEDKNCCKQYTLYQNDQALCSTLILNDYKTSYCLLIGLDKDSKPQGAIQWILWEAIKDSITEGRTFDFEGTMIPEVEPVFRAFGGQLTNYSVLTKTNRILGAAFRLLKGHPI